MKVKDICELINGRAFKPSEWGCEGLPIIRIQNLNDISAPFNYYSGNYNPIHEVNDGELLFSWSGTPGTSFGAFRWCRGKGILNQHIFRVLPKVQVDKEYLRYALNGNLNSIIAKAHGGVGLQHITKKELDEIEVPMPSLEKQLSIVREINLIESVIDCRKQQLHKYEMLIKARFVEMFGDPIRNTQNRPTTNFINIVMMQRGFDLPVQERQQDGSIPVFGSNGALDHHNVAKVHGGGVITGRSGTIGKVYYTEGDYWPLNTSLFSIDTHGNNIIYLAYLLMLYDLSRFTEGTGVPTLNRNKFHNKPIIDVPLEEQIVFANFVKQVDKSKVVIQKALDEAQLLFDSLMQQYFG